MMICPNFKYQSFRRSELNCKDIKFGPSYISGSTESYLQRSAVDYLNAYRDNANNSKHADSITLHFTLVGNRVVGLLHH